jgi:hypothetical protein
VSDVLDRLLGPDIDPMGDLPAMPYAFSAWHGTCAHVWVPGVRSTIPYRHCVTCDAEQSDLET